MKIAWFKKYLLLKVCGLVLLPILALVGLKLWSASQHYARAKCALQTVTDRKQQLDRRDPYPSPENVRHQTENYKDLLDSYNELNEMLRVQPIEPQLMSPADFMPLLENTLRRLRHMLTVAQISYPPKYAFGFERYAEGKMPVAGEVPELVQQLTIIEELVRVLCRLGIAELIVIDRSAAEVAQSYGSADPSAAPADYSWGPETRTRAQHFKLQLKASEAVVIDLLNLLARLPMFTLVTNLKLETAKLTSPGAAAAPAAPLALPARAAPTAERKILLGRELVELELELAVYQFAPALDFRAETRRH